MFDSETRPKFRTFSTYAAKLTTTTRGCYGGRTSDCNSASCAPPYGRRFDEFTFFALLCINPLCICNLLGWFGIPDTTSNDNQ
jgi:hypothetical protein